MRKIANFDDWIDSFRAWQKDIGLELPRYGDYEFEAKYGAIRGRRRSSSATSGAPRSGSA